MTRLLYIVSHPIQYQAPLLRLIAVHPEISLRVLFERDTSQGYYDVGFGREIRWDLPLQDGYDSCLVRETDLAREIAACDVVWLHGWQSRVMHRALAIARRLDRPVLMRGENTTCAMPDGHGLKGWLKRSYLARIFSRCAGFLAIGSDNRDYYLAHGVGQERIFLMPYAIDNESFVNAAAAQPKSAFCRKLNLPDDAPLILFAGKMIPRKHPELLLEAWERAKWPGAVPHLVFAGDGDLRNALEIRAAGRRTIHFLGFRNQSELPGLYAASDVFVLASAREPWGLAVNEAMACGTAVIVSDQVGCARDLVDQSCGAVVPCGDADSLATALADVAGRATQAGIAARRRVSTWDFSTDISGLEQALGVISARRGAR